MRLSPRQICGNAGEVERALALFHDWGTQGVDMDVYCFNAIMGAMLKNGLPDKVFEVSGSDWLMGRLYVLGGWS